ncbi:MAG: tripartite tricarboxylate transporter TctB family protein [Acetobacteraceae bacterium]|nr:tripartite tricarboxylate transporter TctB family protein [Acetobacteraceae bacterium]MDW8397428.1 tripartite tricarboxylate transporter TctB family protein [Acetobacteraceae bacterium]
MTTPARPPAPGEGLLPPLLLVPAAAAIAEGVRLDGLVSPSSPGAFPLIAGAVMAGSAAAIGARAWRRRGAARPVGGLAALLPSRVALVGGLFLAALAAMPWAGFHLPAFLLLLLSVRLLSGRGWLRAALVAAASVAAIHLVFRIGFSVLLPAGVLFR